MCASVRAERNHGNIPINIQISVKVLFQPNAFHILMLSALRSTERDVFCFLLSSVMAVFEIVVNIPQM